MNLLVDILGWAAMILILLGYFLITAGKVDSKSLMYQLLNLVGAVFFVIYLSVQKAWPSVALNVIWALIALIALSSILRQKKRGDSGNVD